MQFLTRRNTSSPAQNCERHKACEKPPMRVMPIGGFFRWFKVYDRFFAMPLCITAALTWQRILRHFVDSLENLHLCGMIKLLQIQSRRLSHLLFLLR